LHIPSVILYMDCSFAYIGRTFAIFLYVTLFEFSVEFKFFKNFILRFAQPGWR